MVAASLARTDFQLGRAAWLFGRDWIARPSCVASLCGCFFWTLGYDTIYAHQDAEDDALVGVKSTARLFGAHSRPWIAAFYACAIACIGAAMWFSTARTWTLFLLAPAGLHFLWQVRRLDQGDTTRCLTIFRSNRDTGLLIGAALVTASYVH